MATIQEQLDYLQETKGLIKNAIINKGQDINDNTPFRSYVNKIENISTINLQSKTIDPTTNQQIITPDQPNYNGLSSVTINAVTSNIDNNITVENIRSGVSILGVTGNYSGIDTSDATATADDIVTVFHLQHGEGYYTPKTAYVNGNKINGNIKETRSINGQIPESPTLVQVENISNISTWLNHVAFNTTIQSNYSYVVNNTSLLSISVLNTALTNVFNITSDKLLNGYTLFGVTGNYSGIDTSDATALVNDIVNGKTAYVNGVKLVGNLNTYNSGDVFEQTISMTAGYDSTNNKLVLGSNPGQCAFKGGTIELSCMGNTIATVANITNDKIVLGENIFGVQGTAMVMRGTNLDVNLSTTAQSITPTSPYTGFTVVNIPAVTASIDNNIVAGNIKNGVTILGVTGSYEGINTFDANATNNDIVAGKTAYVNGQKIVGSIPYLYSGGAGAQSAVYRDMGGMGMVGVHVNVTQWQGSSNYIGILKSGDEWNFTVDFSVMANAINLTPNILKSGETVLGVTGNYAGSSMKEYNSETAMNNDIANISEGEVVKVVVSNVTTFYVKETTMKKLVKEEDTISPQEYNENLEITEDILGEPEPEIQDHYEIEYE